MTANARTSENILEMIKHLQSLGLAQDPDERPRPKVELKMTREDYIRKQNALFREMADQPSWGEMCARLSHEQSLAFPGLVELLQLYVASLDERIYTEIEAHEESQKIIDNERQKLLQKWEISSNEPLSAFEWLADQIALVQGQFLQLRAEITVLSEQRDELEKLRADIKRKYALELARRIRLEHVVQMLGRRLLAADSEIREKNEVIIGTKHSISEEKVPLSQDNTTEARLDRIEKILNLPQSTASFQERLSILIPLLGPKIESSTVEVLNAFRSQAEQREGQLVAALEEAQANGQIYLARADRLAAQCESQRKEIAGLVERSAGLAITEKELRSENQAVKQELQDLKAVLVSMSSENEP